MLIDDIDNAMVPSLTLTLGLVMVSVVSFWFLSNLLLVIVGSF